WNNVYLPHNSAQDASLLPPSFTDPRICFVGQVWIGISTWPAICQYYFDDEKQAREVVQQYLYDADYPTDRERLISVAKRNNAPREVVQLLQNLPGENFDGRDAVADAYAQARKAGRLLGTYQRAPSEKEINRLQRNSDKTLDLGYVYTVIAGLLN